LYPDAHCALIHKNAYELIVATILSAQCTDARVNLVTPTLFRRFPDAASLATAKTSELEDIIRSTGFFRAKTKNLIGMAQAVVARHEGEIPSDLEALTNLPGVGRKTAHVVLGNAFGKAEGIVVDTHVKRLSYRLGLTDETTPEAIEHDLVGIIPKKYWIDLSHQLIDHGRAVCKAISPRCAECSLLKLCPQRGVK
jgi:endonuclease-3